MEKTSLEKITAIKSFLKANMNIEGKTVEQIRKELDYGNSNTPSISGISIKEENVCGMNSEWIRHESIPEANTQTILYFHGGAFISGSCISHRDLASRISKASGVRVLVVEYRLAPEFKYPAANEDCLKAYNWLINNGVSPENIILGGESTGGYLVLSTLLSLRDASKPMPAAAFLLSPHTDFLYYNGESYITRAELDPLGSLKGAQSCAASYFDSAIKDPAVLSPLNENLSGLPSLFIQVGDHEVILDDSTRLEERAKEAGVDATLEIWDNMWHIFRFMAAMLPEAVQAIDNIGTFVKEKLR